MEETAQQYTQRLIGNVAGRNPVEILESTTRRLEELSRTLKEKGMHTKPAPDRWSAAQIMAHLAEGEIVSAYRFRRILNSSGETIEAYDQNVWVRNSGYLQADPDLALALFQTTRRANLAFLKALTPEQWECYGIHAERGKESLRHLANMVAGHDINHLKQLDAML